MPVRRRADQAALGQREYLVTGGVTVPTQSVTNVR